VAAKLFPSDDRQRKGWTQKLTRRLNRGCVDAEVTELRAFPARKPDLRRTLRVEADYFGRNRRRMRYPKFRKQGLFYGSGAIEAGCKTAIGFRLKHHCPSLQTLQRRVRGLWGVAACRLTTHIYVAPSSRVLNRSGDSD
jgi:hypothetical protein